MDHKRAPSLIIVIPDTLVIYIFQHINIEGPGTLGDFLQAHDVPARTVRLFDGDQVPEEIPADLSGLVILGGPMNVYEDDRYPYLNAEVAFLKKMIKQDVLTLGLCLGAQLIAWAAGARVYKAPEPEIGFYDILLTAEGQKDPLFDKVESRGCFFQWHQDTFDVPETAVLLARGAKCPNQIFRIGQKVYGLQCHMEMTAFSAVQWAARYVDDSAERDALNARLAEEFDLYEENLCQISEKIYNNLLKIMGSSAG
ncbi:MAG: type 1 glutamine amidotransferase [Candidatus Omnitrophota bacterium]